MTLHAACSGVKPPEEGSRSTDSFSPLLAGLLLVVLSGLVPALLVGSTRNRGGPAWLAPLLVTGIVGARYAWMVAQGRQRLVEMSVWLFTYVFLGLAPLVQLRTRVWPDTTPGMERVDLAPALFVVALGTAALGAGMLLSAGTTVARSDPLPTQVELSSFRVIALSAAALLFSVYYERSVQLTALLSSRADLTAAAAAAWPNTTTRAVVQAAAGMTLLTAFVAICQARRRSPTASQRTAWALLLAVVSVQLALIVNPISSARFVFGTAALGVLASLGLFRSARAFRMMAVAALVGLIFVFPLADAFRYSNQADFKTRGLVSALESADYDAFAQTSNATMYVRERGSTHGRQALGVLTFWVPRSIWDNKPVDTGILLANYRGYSVTNLSAPLWAELYINGAWPALLIGMLTFGVLIVRWDRRIWQTLARDKAPGVLASILPFYLFILLRGSLLQAMAYLTVILLSSRLVVARRSNPAERPGGAGGMQAARAYGGPSDGPVSSAERPGRRPPQAVD